MSFQKRYLMRLVQAQRNWTGVTPREFERVGGAILSANGQIYTGNNTRSDGSWANVEWMALRKKAAAGDGARIEKIALAGNGGKDLLFTRNIAARWLLMPGVTARTMVVMADSQNPGAIERMTVGTATAEKGVGLLCTQALRACARKTGNLSTRIVPPRPKARIRSDRRLSSRL